jgi:uncharacterized protein (DUF1499 family)
MRLLKWILLVFAVGLVLFFVLRWLVGRASPMPENVGTADGLAPCPASPNCVSSYESDAEHGMEALVYEGETAVSQARLLAIIQSMPGSTVVTNEPGYIHAEFRSAAWGFVDDVEFYFDEEAGLIQFRSAARLGYGDGGVNRKRMEDIRAAYTENE